ncbi:MAG TPA: alpha/beta fold hydrolase [Pyrinomonadaceae bacterium]|nr:alpha/beta fold hydrolase [Pyrinomonadaceae bacterium]
MSSPVVVLLHGYPFNRSMWRDQIDFLSEHGYRAIAPDLRGLGENVTRTSGADTLKSVPPAKMDDMARDVATLMDELKIESAAICGLSMGCYVAFEFLRLFSQRVRALIICGPRAQGPDAAEKESRESQARRVLAEGMGIAVDSISTTLLARQTLDEKPAIVARVREMVLRTDRQGAAAAQIGMAMRRDYADDLATVSVPTLIFAGSEDGVRKPEDAEFIHQRIKNSRLEVLTDAGHLMNMEQAEEFNKELVGFLKLIH